jgi:hypothetical protein
MLQKQISPHYTPAVFFFLHRRAKHHIVGVSNSLKKPSGKIRSLNCEVVDQAGNPFSGRIAPIDWSSTPHVCPVFGAEEVWELVNTTDKMHNFHIHQRKFRLADAKLDKGVPAGLVPIVATGPDCAKNIVTSSNTRMEA